jgi:hypothetical protein
MMMRDNVALCPSLSVCVCLIVASLLSVVYGYLCTVFPRQDKGALEQIVHLRVHVLSILEDKHESPEDVYRGARLVDTLCQDELS